MPTNPTGYAPAIPGLTGGNGLSPASMNPMQLVAMLMGDSPASSDSTTEKMAKIVQLLREVSKEDPRISLLASDALRLLVEGPQTPQPGTSPVAGGNSVGSVMPPGAGSPGSIVNV